MIIKRATKGKLYPNKTQQNKIDATLNCCRFIYNEMLARNIKIYKRRGEHLSYYQMQYLLKTMKGYRPWLKEADSQALAYACRQLDTAYEKFFRHESRFPRFHKKNGRQAYTSTNPVAIHIDGNKIKIPTVGWVKVRGLNKPEDADICRITVSREPDGKYYVSVLYKYETEITPHSLNFDNITGLDYSSSHLYVDSDGNIPAFEHQFCKSQVKLAREQRILSRRQGSRKGEKKSSNWHKQYRKVCRLQSKISNQRNDALHKISKSLADTYDAIGVEDIDMKSLSNKGFGNGKATLDNGYGAFRVMLDYKLQDRGKPPLIKVDRFYPSSQICHCCGYQNPALKDLSIRKWTCSECGTTHDRDHNAAINIRNEAIHILKATYSMSA